MIFVLIPTSQLIAVIVGIMTMNVIWFNPDPCPNEYMKLEIRELHKVCELQYYGGNKSWWVLKEE